MNFSTVENARETVKWSVFKDAVWDSKNSNEPLRALKNIPAAMTQKAYSWSITAILIEPLPSISFSRAHFVFLVRTRVDLRESDPVHDPMTGFDDMTTPTL